MVWTWVCTKTKCLLVMICWAIVDRRERLLSAADMPPSIHPVCCFARFPFCCAALACFDKQNRLPPFNQGADSATEAETDV
jgi:hypothetical protein